MSSQRFICPECREVINLKSSNLEKTKIRCPECDELIRTDDLEKAKSSNTAKGGKSNKEGVPIWMPITAISLAGVGLLTILLVVILSVTSDDKKPQAKQNGIPSSGTSEIPSSQTSNPETPPTFVPPKKSGGVATTNGTRPAGSGTVRPTGGFTNPFPPMASTGGPIRTGGTRPRDPIIPVDLPPLPPENERPILVLNDQNHNSVIRKIAITKDAKTFITVGNDKMIRFWDMETGETTRIIHMPVGKLNEGTLDALALSPDDKKLYVGGWPLDAEKNGILLYVIDIAKGEVEKTMKGHNATLTDISVSPDGQTIASCNAPAGTIILYKQDGTVLANLKEHKQGVNTVRFHPKDNTVFASGCVDGTARIWKIQGPNRVTSEELKGHTMEVFSVAWSKDGQTLATGSADGSIRLYTKAGQPIKTIARETNNHPGGPLWTQMMSMHFVNDDKEIVFAGVENGGSAGIVTLETGKRRLMVKGHDNTIFDSRVTQDGQWVVSTGGSGQDILVWSPKDGKVRHHIKSKGMPVTSVGWEGDRPVLWYGRANAGGNTLFQGTSPLTANFGLEEMGRTRPPQEVRISRPILVHRDLKLEKNDFFVAEVKKGNTTFATLKSPHPRDPVRAATFITPTQVLFTTSRAIYLYDLDAKRITKTFDGHSSEIWGIAPSPKRDYFVTGSIDQTIRIWKLDRTEPILSIFTAGEEWIAWTPEGYYAASANGERLMGWQINNGPFKTATFYPAIQFRQSLYQPYVIQNLFRADGDIRKAIALTIAERGKPVPVLNLTQVMPPVVTVSAPATAFVQTNQETIEVVATARSTGKHPVRSMRVLVDGRPYQGAKGVKEIAAPKLGDVTMKFTVTVPPGKHTITVQADTQMSKGLSQNLVVESTLPKREPNLYVVAVGISAYSGKLKLNYAATDAQLITQTLQDKANGVFGKVEVKQILDREATKDAILKGMDWLSERMTAQDVGIFYFSGHGGLDDEDTFYLIPVDITRDIRRTGLQGDIVRDRLADMPGRVVCIMDACHSGVVADSFQVGKADNLVRDLVTDDCGVVVLSSSLGSEFSLESSEIKAGFFTYSLAEGLRGKADLNNDGFVFINEANVYATIRVKQLSRGDQNPTLGRTPNLKPFPLSKP